MELKLKKKTVSRKKFELNNENYRFWDKQMNTIQFRINTTSIYLSKEERVRSVMSCETIVDDERTY